jgi:ADP-ribose pyrophosphatase
MIPKNAKCVFKGVIFDVYQWKQKMFDGTFGTFEGVKRRPSVQIIAIVGNKIMLQNEEQPGLGKFVSFPGGVIDDGEKPLFTAKRELLEEAGMEASKMQFWRKADFSKKIEWETFYFIAKDCKKIQVPHLDAGEKIKPLFVSFEKFVEVVSREDFRNREFSNYMFRLKQNKEKLEEFRKIIFS